MTAKEAKIKGDKSVMINGFKEDVDYAVTLKNLVWVGETKNYDGYSFIQCYTC
jgi:hypothetical protein